MKHQAWHILFALQIFLSLSIHAQERIQQGKMYHGGDYVYAPLTGTYLTIPEHWRGYGTQETEMMTLSSDTSNATLRIFSVRENLVTLKSRMKTGFEIMPGIIIQPIGQVQFDENVLSTEIKMSNDQNLSGYYFVKCGEFGNCVGFLFGTQTKTHKRYLNGLNEVLEEVELKEPTFLTPGADYDWAENLSGKHLFHYESNRSGTVGNQIWLCEDGTFTAKLKRKGMFNQGNQRKIKGNHSGTYLLEGIGTEGLLTLRFESLDDYEMVLKGIWKDGEIFLNTVKYYQAVHQNCK